jgi:hypothetical protein
MDKNLTAELVCSQPLTSKVGNVFCPSWLYNHTRKGVVTVWVKPVRSQLCFSHKKGFRSCSAQLSFCFMFTITREKSKRNKILQSQYVVMLLCNISVSVQCAVYCTRRQTVNLQHWAQNFFLVHKLTRSLSVIILQFFSHP